MNVGPTLLDMYHNKERTTPREGGENRDFDSPLAYGRSVSQIYSKALEVPIAGHKAVRRLVVRRLYHFSLENLTVMTCPPNCRS